jgi:putative glutamine amidotransferase
MNPVIGINTNVHAPNAGHRLLTLSSGYSEAVHKAGGLPTALPPIVDACDEYLNHVDGLVMTGGADLDCRLDGRRLHDSMHIMDPARENFDRELIERAAVFNKPVLAIGAGMQLLNVAFGGTLFLDISSDVRGGSRHYDSSDPNHCHALGVEEDSFVGHVYQRWTKFPREIVVNSMHHQAVSDVANGFCVTAHSALDGVIEAIESTGDWFAVGVQFHPERMHTAIDQSLFSEFVDFVATTLIGDVGLD